MLIRPDRVNVLKVKFFQKFDTFGLKCVLINKVDRNPSRAIEMDFPESL